jgi:hypothetical protein
VDLEFMPAERGKKVSHIGMVGKDPIPQLPVSSYPVVKSHSSGAWSMAISWSVPTGFNTPFAYFYPVWFTFMGTVEMTNIEP